MTFILGVDWRIFRRHSRFWRVMTRVLEEIRLLRVKVKILLLPTCNWAGGKLESPAKTSSPALLISCQRTGTPSQLSLPPCITATPLNIQRNHRGIRIISTGTTRIDGSSKGNFLNQRDVALLIIIKDISGVVLFELMFTKHDLFETKNGELYQLCGQILANDFHYNFYFQMSTKSILEALVSVELCIVCNHSHLQQ